MRKTKRIQPVHIRKTEETISLQLKDVQEIDELEEERE